MNQNDILQLITNNQIEINGKRGKIINLTSSDVNAEPVGAVNDLYLLLTPKINYLKQLSESNELKISNTADQVDFEQLQQKVEENRLALLTKSDIQALAMLSQLVDTKADQSYVQQQIANLVGSAPEALNTIYELAEAIKNEQGLINGINQSVANRVRFDVAEQALAEIQKENARTNIGAEKVGTAQQLVSQITAQSLGAATSAQGNKADTALQSADVAPVALSGVFSSLSGQSKIFDVVYSAYQIGTNTALSATDTLGQMFGKLQAQINAKASANVWVDISTVSTLSNGVASISSYPLQVAVIEGYLWIRGGFSTTVTFGAGNTLFQITNSAYKPRITYSDLSGYITRAGFYASYGTSTAGINGMVGMGFRQNVNGQNFFELTSTSAANSAGFYISPTPIAKI